MFGTDNNNNNNNKFYSPEVETKQYIGLIKIKTTSGRLPESQLAINAGRLWQEMYKKKTRNIMP